MHILGIDIGGSGIKGAPVDVIGGDLMAERHRIATPKPATPEKVAKVVAKLVRRFEWEGALGCAIPARVKHGIALTAANIDDAWIGTNACALIEAATGLETHVLNDADAAGMAEMAFGAGRERRGLVLTLTFGTGIGSGLFIDQKLVPNTEFGHFELNGINAEFYAADSARKREKLTWKRWAGRVQEYLDHVEFLLSPDLIIIGGGVSKPKRWDKFAKYLDTKAELVPATLRNEAGIVGAAVAAHREAERLGV